MNSIGLSIVKNQLVLQGNETLLNNLKEGVVIANSETGQLMFANSAAEKLNVYLTEQ